MKGVKMRFFRDRLTERHEVEIRKVGILRFLEGLFLGLSIGSFIGVMLAPKSGKDTLIDIKNTSNRLKDEVIHFTTSQSAVRKLIYTPAVMLADINIDGNVYSVTSSSYTPSGNLSIGTHNWKVLAKNASGSSAYSTNWSFSINTAPVISSFLPVQQELSVYNVAPEVLFEITVFDPDVSDMIYYNWFIDNDNQIKLGGYTELYKYTDIITHVKQEKLDYGVLFYLIKSMK
jgi:hypothetical protein